MTPESGPFPHSTAQPWIGQDVAHGGADCFRGLGVHQEAGVADHFGKTGNVGSCHRAADERWLRSLEPANDGRVHDRAKPPVLL